MIEDRLWIEKLLTNSERKKITHRSEYSLYIAHVARKLNYRNNGPAKETGPWGKLFISNSARRVRVHIPGKNTK